MSSRWLSSCLFVITVLVMQRPVHDADLWWNLARGRAVVSGSLNASQSLLLLDSTAESDWLSGLAWWTAWEYGGIHLLAAVPVCAAIVLLWLIFRPEDRARNSVVLLLAAPLFLLMIRPDVQPGPEWFDLLGLTLLWVLARARMRFLVRGYLIVFLFAGWANFGPRPVWGLLWLATVEWLHCEQRLSSAAQSSTKFSSRGQSAVITHAQLLSVVLPLALIGGIFTPRGWNTWTDSLVLFSPSSFEALHVYANSGWTGLFSRHSWTASEAAFVIAWTSIACWLLTSSYGGADTACSLRSRWYTFAAALMVPLLAVCLCRDNVPVAGLWILLVLLRSVTPAWCRINGFTGTVRGRRIVLIATGILLTGVLIDAAGRGLCPYRRMGWGIAQEIDPRLLNVQLQPVAGQPLIGWAADSRSAGVAVWLYPELQLVDHPQRALLGGRLNDHAAFIADLQGAHRARYRRSDGTWGGWVQQLADWRVEVMLIAVEMEQLNRELQNTTWKALDLDSPTIPYVSTDDNRYANAILETIQQLSFVEVGPWQPGMEVYDGQGWRYDFIEMLSGDVDAAAAIRQSQHFRAAGIPLAALRALLPVRQRVNHPWLQAEFHRCQQALVDQERINFGQASDFRRLVVQRLQHAADGFQEVHSDIAAKAEGWVPVINLYLSGHLQNALDLLPEETAQQQFTKSMLWLELGDVGNAQQALQMLLRQRKSSAMRIAGEYWSDQISLFESR